MSNLIYELEKIYVSNHSEITENKIDTYSEPSGYFDSVFLAETYMKKHNKDDTHHFFIMRSWVINPTYYDQVYDYITERTYDYEGNLICDCNTHHIATNLKILNEIDNIKFKGRDDCPYKKDDIVWCYKTGYLIRCKIGELPFDTEKSKNYDCLDYTDDSYLVYPLNEMCSHDHILSCYVFSTKFVNSLITF